MQQTLDLLDSAADHCQSLRIRWVRAHSGHTGNVLADTAARAGRDDHANPDWETPLLAKAVMHCEINKMAKRLWINKWDELLECRQTRHFFPNGPRPSFSRDVVNLDKIICGQVVQLLTGHTYMKRHQAIIDDSERQRIIAVTGGNADSHGNAIIDAPDASCDLCHNGEETPLHLLSECDALATLRKDQGLSP